MRKADKYILDHEGQPQVCEDLYAWGRWMENGDRHVALTKLGEDVRVSTVFLGLDHSFSDEGEPVLWETMIFGGEHDQYQKRYTSEADALDGHNWAVTLAKGS